MFLADWRASFTVVTGLSRLHVVQRGIIFIDIAMPQMASLGICLAVLFHLDLQGWPLSDWPRFTLSSRHFLSDWENVEQIPQEAVIGTFLMLWRPAAVLL